MTQVSYLKTKYLLFTLPCGGASVTGVALPVSLFHFHHIRSQCHLSDLHNKYNDKLPANKNNFLTTQTINKNNTALGRFEECWI